ncbi:M48 family metallopeptidase [Streptomyces sp. NPDC101249]|uniref:M48 family metallopeptidase n=1 Tax=Streptomyces sp. NPDC101249 TaxID=3366140 RepID=UPI0038098D9A
MSVGEGAVVRAVEERTLSCPECRATVRVDDRFSVWCQDCDWNVDPQPPEEDDDRLERVRRAMARRHGERLYAEIAAGGSLRAHRDRASIPALALALAVHAVTLALLLGGLWCVIAGWGGWGIVPGALLLLLAWVLRPRSPRPRGADPELLRADAPELYALVDDVARVVGTRSVDRIVVTTEVNASVRVHGVRGRRWLALGLPLWEILTPQQRVALLGHELAHYSNGDTRHGVVVGTAYRSLATWHYVFLPITDPAAAEMLANVLFTVPRLALRGLLEILDHLTLRAAQRAEYLADREAARAGSTEAAVGLMDRLLVAESVTVALRREANRAALTGPRGARAADAHAVGIWERLRTDIAAIPESEYERQRRAGARRGHSVDSAHPPTHLRRACLLLGPAADAVVVLDEDRARRVESELAPVRTTVARTVVRDGC